MDDNLTRHYFDAESIKILDDNGSNHIFLDVWIKVAYNGAGKDNYRKSLRKAKLSTAGYENFSYAVNHVLFGEGQICLLGIYDYTDDGVILRCFDAPAGRWMGIIPGSTMEVWYKHVIAFTLANMKSIIKNNV